MLLHGEKKIMKNCKRNTESGELSTNIRRCGFTANNSTAVSEVRFQVQGRWRCSLVMEPGGDCLTHRLFRKSLILVRLLMRVHSRVSVNLLNA